MRQRVAVLALALLACVACGATISVPIAPPRTNPQEPPKVPQQATLGIVTVDAATGAPVAGARVTLVGLDKAGETNGDGYIDFLVLRRQIDVTVVADHYERAQVFTSTEEGNYQQRIPLRRLVVLQNLNVFVLDAQGRPIAESRVTVNGETRRTGADGFVNFAIGAPQEADVSAMGYYAKRVALPPGDHRVHLERIPPPAPPTPVDPTPNPTPGPAPVYDACGVEGNTMAISQACLAAVAARSLQWLRCAAGEQHACHYYVREVAVALATTQADARWGIITKPSGSNVEGYGEDVVAYLPRPIPLSEKTWRWRGLDIVGGAGAPNARFQGGPLNEALACPQPSGWCNRTDNLWAPVPR